jgi:hypothetical protein
MAKPDLMLWLDNTADGTGGRGAGEIRRRRDETKIQDFDETQQN